MVEIAEIRQISHEFTRQLSASARGGTSSLKYIRNKVPISTPEDPEPFQVIVVGGSVFFTSIASKRNGKISIQSIRTDKLPIFKTKEIFLSFIKSIFNENITRLALDCAFPITGDGELLYGTKEHVFEGLVGQNICREIESAFSAEGKNVRVVIANDTICLLLSGLTVVPWKNISAGIVGTGFNMALFEDAGTAVNLEAGNFNGFKFSTLLRSVDAKSVAPGVHMVEKAIAGGYLHKIFNESCILDGITREPVRSTEELDTVARAEGDGECGRARTTFAVAAAYAAALIAGQVNYLDRDQTFVMEGSLFWKGYRFKETVEQLIPLLTHHTIDFVHVENSGVLGAAQLIT